MTARPLPDLTAALTRLVDPDAPGVPDAELLRRFAETRDEAAFELIVWRHGGMVLGTCRRVLGRSPDADDAFQAAFLALALRAGSVRHGASLPGWLHRVALRSALRLRAAAIRTRHEPFPPTEVAAPAEPLPDDTAAVLDEEIGRLPDKLRVAFVLCELEGRTDSEAATQLGCPKGTVLSRLARARERLRARLTRRGLAGAAVAAVVAEPAALTAARVAATARAGVAFVTGRTEGAAPAPTAALARGVLRALAVDTLRPVAVVLAVAVLAAIAVGAALASRGPSGNDPPPSAPLVAPRFAAAPIPKAAPAPVPNYKLPTADHGLAQVDEVRFSPDGKWLVTAGSRPKGDDMESAVAVWDAATGKHLRTFTKPDGVGAALAFSPDGKLFAASCAGEAVVALWETATWKVRASVPHPIATDVYFSPDGKLLLTRSCAFEKEVISEVNVWHTDTGKRAFALARRADETFYAAEFSPDGKTLAVGNNLGVVQLFDTKTGKARTEIKPPGSKLTEAAFSRSGDKLLTWAHAAETNFAVRVWDAATGKEERKLEGDGPVRFATFSPDGKRIATMRNTGATKGAVAWVWDAETGKKSAALTLSQEHPAEAHYLAFSPDSGLLVVCGTEQRRNGNKLITEAVGVAYSVPDGKELLRLPDVEGVMFNHTGTAAALLKRTREGDEVTVRGVAELLKQK